MAYGVFMKRRDLPMVALMTVILWAAAILLWSAQDIASGSLIPWPYRVVLLGTFAIGLVFSALLAIILMAARRLPRPASIALTGLTALALAALHGWIDAHMMAWMRPLLGYKAGSISDLFLVGLMPFVLIYCLYAMALGLMLSTATARQREIQLSEARSAAQQAQLAALRFQLNPHFMFNTLNAISSLIVTQRNGDAERMTLKLADFLRITLETDPEATVSLDEELATTQCYLDIEKARFGDRLNVSVECPTALLEAHLPSLLLQPVIENAIKYAVAPARHQVTISIRAMRHADGLRLMIEDNGGRAFGNRPSGSTGLGLANVRQRLAAFYGDRAALEALATERGFAVTITIPLHLAPVAEAAE